MPLRRDSGLSLLAFLFMAAAVAPLGLNIVVPALPAFGLAFDAPHATVQLTLSLFLLVFGAFQLVLGPAADRYGRKPVLLGAFMLFIAASLWAASATSIESLVLARALQAAGGCAALVVPRAVIRDCFTGHAAARAMAYVSMAPAVVPALAPLLGALLITAFGWRSIFVFCAGYAALLMAWTLASFEESLPPDRRVRDGIAALARRYLSLLRSRAYIGYTLNFALLGAGFVAFISVAPVLLIRGLGVSPVAYGVYNLLLGASLLTGSAAAPALARRYATARLLFFASLLAVSSFAAMLALSGTLSIWRLMAPMLVYGWVSGFIFPLALTGAISIDPRIAGAASAFIGFVQMALGSIVVFVVGQFETATARPLALVSLTAAAGGLASVGLLYSSRR